VPDSGGTPATVIVTIDVDDLLGNTGYGVASDGSLIRTDKVRPLTDQAEVYTAFLTGHREVLRLDRSRRIASRGQSIALYATRGWDCTINPDGLPEWSPPRWVDRNRTPLINTRIRASLAARSRRRQ
jgi:hypothetical protein